MTVLNQRNPDRSPTKQELEDEFLRRQLPRSLEMEEVIKLISRYLEIEELMKPLPPRLVTELRKFLQNKSGSSQPEKEE